MRRMHNAPVERAVRCPLVLLIQIRRAPSGQVGLRLPGVLGNRLTADGVI